MDGYDEIYTGRGMDADSEYIRLDQKIRESLDKMIRNVAALSMDLQQLGTARDMPQVRERLYVLSLG